jgi:hypothetical protein
MDEIILAAKFIWAIVTNWLVLAGGTVMTAFGIVERLRGKEVHWRVYRRILSGLLMVAFYLSWRDAKLSPVASPPFTVNANIQGVTDTDAHAKIVAQQKQIAAEEAELLKLRNEALERPLDEPIASARVMVFFTVSNNKQPATQMDGQVSAVAFAKGASVLFQGGTFIHNSDGNGNYNLTVDFPMNDPYMGKSVRSIADAEYIQIEFDKDFVPLNTNLTGGQVILTINNRVTLKFKIPAQNVTQIIRQDRPAISVRDLDEGLAPLKRLSTPKEPTEVSGPKPTS